ncbi:MAG: 4Fe-4S binding protein, partial [Anaerolineae bacterium]
GVILASRDSVALDVVATSIVGIEPLSVPTLREARERGLWSGWVEDIETLGETIQEVFVSDFVKPMASHRLDVGIGLPLFGNYIRPFFVNLLTIRPVPQRGLCTACRTCVRSCPEGAITIVDKLAIVDHKRCIRCYCCHELCPEGAIGLERPWLSRLLSR